MSASAKAEALIPSEILRAPVVPDLFGLSVGVCERSGLHMEFGVATGRSLKIIRELLPIDIPLYGFDSFDGLPESWNGFKKGSFSTGLRVSLANTKLIVGLYENTLREFVDLNPGLASFIHIDCDLYSSTKTVLTEFRRRIIPGTIILFDELFGFAGYEQHEYKALRESGIRYEVIGRWNAYRAAIRVIK